MSLKALSIQRLSSQPSSQPVVNSELTGGVKNQSTFRRSVNRVDAVFNPVHWQQIISETVADFGHRDPRAGCWQWILEHHPDLWREHQTATREIDQAYQQQDTGKIEKAVSRAKGTYNAMLEAWSKNQHTQPSLLTA